MPPTPPSVTRTPSASFVIYDADRDHAYKLRPADIQAVEEFGGRTLEYLPEETLVAALTALHIPLLVPDDLDWARIAPQAASVTPSPAPPSSIVVPLPKVESPIPPAPPPAPPPRRPWRWVAPLIAGAVVLIALLILVRSCGSGVPAGPEPTTPTPAETALPATTQPGAPTVTARADAAVYAGPGEAYAVVGVLLAGQSVEALGVSMDGGWYAIRFFAAPSRLGWVSSNSVTAEHTEGLPVIEPPPLPTATATSIPTATPPPTVTATPSPTAIPAPIAIIDGPTEGRTGERLRYSARGSTAAPGSSLVAFAWEFGDGSTSSGIEVEKIFDRPGDYRILLQVTDSNGLTAQATKQVEISAAPVSPTPSPPQAAISAPAQAGVDQPVLFDGRGSTAPEPIEQYRWTFGDGGMDEGARVSHTYRLPGRFNVTLAIIDRAGRESIATSVIEILGPTVTPEAEPIVGTRWAMTAYFDEGGNPIAALPGVASTAFFGPDGVLSGSGGCNDYTAGYSASGTSLSISPPAATGRACTEPPGITEQETAFLRLLPQSASYRMGSSYMELIGAGGNVLVQFTPQVQPG